MENNQNKETEVQANDAKPSEEIQIDSGTAVEEKKASVEGEGEPKKEMIQRHGKIMNEEGEWEDYVEEDDPDRPPIAYDYMGSEGLPIEADAEVVDFCMQYRIPKLEGLTECTNLKVSFRVI